MAYYGGGFYNTILAEAAERRAAEESAFRDLPPSYGTTASATTGGLPGAPAPADLAKQATGYATGVYTGSPFYANTEALRAGVIPPDVKRQLTQAAAERGVAIGTPGAPVTNAGLLRALGLTSLDLQQTGLKDWATILGTAPQVNLQSLYQTPSEKAALAQQQQLARLSQQTQYGLAGMQQQYGIWQSQQAQAAAEAARQKQWEQAILGSQATGQVLNEYLRRYSPTAPQVPSFEGYGGTTTETGGGDTGYFDVSPEYASAMWEAPNWYLTEGGWEEGEPLYPTE